MKMTNRKFVIAYGVLILTGICVAIALLLYFPQRVRATFSRPLVLIHDPINNEQLSLDEGIIIHATARNDKGISRIELWADGAFVKAYESPIGPTTPLVFHSSWQPTSVGKHILVVRAISSDNVDGQSTINVEVVEADLILDTHIVEEGETLESIAEEHGTSEEELSDLNPDLPPEGPAPGDSIDVPAGGGSDESDVGGDEPDVESPPAGDEPAIEPPPADEEPPEPHPDAPGGFADVLDFYLGLELSEFLIPDEDIPIGLLIEVLSFSTSSTYEGVNCYASLGDGAWDEVELEGASNFIEWPGDQPLLFDSECVGIIAGGTDSVDLSRLAMRIPRLHWDGVTRSASSIGGEGSYNIQYRVSQEELTPKDPDPDMAVPFNVHLDDFRYALRWEYFPNSGEDPIDGFRIYLNDNLQWVERRENTRMSELPPEWFTPPCGETYRFTVTAFRGYTPDAPESYHSDPPAIAEIPAEDCQREVRVTFNSLTTFDLGGDGDADHRTGDLGPVHGYFFTNRQRATYDTGSLGGGARVGTATGISHNTTYDLSEFAVDETRSWYGYPMHNAEMPEGQVLTVGFHMMDEDSGRCTWSTDPDCDDLVCEAETFHFTDFDYVREYTLRSENGRCEINYTIGPSPGSPIGSSSSAYPPLPWIEVVDLLYNEEEGQEYAVLLNTGSTSWPYQILSYTLSSPGGSPLIDWWFAEFGLEPGAMITLLLERRPPTPALDFCISIFPQNNFPDYYETWRREPGERFCPDFPDLVITSVEHDATGAGRLRVTVQNIGEKTMDNRTLRLETTLADGSRAYLDGMWPNVTLRPGDTTTRDIVGLSDHAMEQLASGFTITVDPDEEITESDEGNNTYTAEGLVKIRFDPIELRPGNEYMYQRAGEHELHCRAEYYFEMYVGHGHAVNEAEWVMKRFPSSGEVIYVLDTYSCSGSSDSFRPHENYDIEIVVPSGEDVYVRVKGWEVDAGDNTDYLGEILVEHPAEENYGEGTHGWFTSSGGSCNDARPRGDPQFVARWEIFVSP